MKKFRAYTLLLFYFILLLTFGCVRAFRYTMGCANIAADQSFSIFITSDIHHFSKELYDNGKSFQEFLMSGDGKLLQYSGELIDALIRDIERDRPDFLIVTGDLTCNGEKKSHQELVKKFEAIEAAGTCVLVVPGNHDVQNPWASQYIGDTATTVETVTLEEYLSLYDSFGYSEAIAKDENSLSYMAIPAEDTWLLMLDTADYGRNMSKKYPEMHGSLSVKTLKWIEQCAALADESNARLIAVMHHSLLHHSDILNDKYTLENCDELLNIFKNHGIEIVMTGHVHVQDIKTCEYDGKTIYDIATSSLSVFPHQYGRLRYTPNVGFEYSTSMVDIGKWSRQQGLSDEYLCNFEEYSAEFFSTQCGRMHKNCLARQEGLSEEEMRLALEAVDKMNMLYFAGYRNEAMNGIVGTEGFKILERISPCFTKEYAMSMLNDEFADNNKLFIPVIGEGRKSEN
jgi:3',5'-cyclic AMP phosphodiesterase CpdA